MITLVNYVASNHDKATTYILLLHVANRVRNCKVLATKPTPPPLDRLFICQSGIKD